MKTRRRGRDGRVTYVKTAGDPASAYNTPARKMSQKGRKLWFYPPQTGENRVKSRKIVIGGLPPSPTGTDGRPPGSLRKRVSGGRFRTVRRVIRVEKNS